MKGRGITLILFSLTIPRINEGKNPKIGSGNNSAAPRLSDSNSSLAELGEDKVSCQEHGRHTQAPRENTEYRHKKNQEIGQILCVLRVSLWFFRVGKQGTPPNHWNHHVSGNSGGAGMKLGR
jgi:hypothetical protein